MPEKIGDEGMYEFNPEEIEALVKAQDETEEKSSKIVKDPKPVQYGSYNNEDPVMVELSQEQIADINNIQEKSKLRRALDDIRRKLGLLS